MEVLTCSFTAYGEDLARIEVFKHLGHLVAYNDGGAKVVRGNIKKARGTWARISKVLGTESASSRICGMFYRATVQAILLYGNETWNLTPALSGLLEGFYVCAARRMTGPISHKVSGNWECPESGEVMAAAGLHTIKNYIDLGGASTK